MARDYPVSSPYCLLIALPPSGPLPCLQPAVPTVSRGGPLPAKAGCSHAGSLSSWRSMRFRTVRYSRPPCSVSRSLAHGRSWRLPVSGSRAACSLESTGCLPVAVSPWSAVAVPGGPRGRRRALRPPAWAAVPSSVYGRRGVVLGRLRSKSSSRGPSYRYIVSGASEVSVRCYSSPYFR